MRQRPDALILIAVYEFVMAAMLLIASCIVLPIALVITPFTADTFGQFADALRAGRDLPHGRLRLRRGVGHRGRSAC